MVRTASAGCGRVERRSGAAALSAPVRQSVQREVESIGRTTLAIDRRSGRIAQDTTLNEEGNHRSGSGARPADDAPREENGPSIEYLQRAIARLLMKNEKMRFELFALRQRISVIDRAVFGLGSRRLRKQLPPHLLGVLCDLCRGQAADPEPPALRSAESQDDALRSRAKHPGDPPQE